MAKFINPNDRPWGPGHPAYEYNLALDRKRAKENKATPRRKSLVKFWGPGHPDYDEMWRSYREQWVYSKTEMKRYRYGAAEAIKDIDAFIASKKPKKKIYNPTRFAANEEKEICSK